MDHAHSEPHAHRHRDSHGAAPAAGASATDPVCGMRVDPGTTTYHAEHGQATYHFCSAGCRSKFVADPARYLSADKRPSEGLVGAVYTCPMHPEIRRDQPGSCPICGMGLEPLTPTSGPVENAELKDMNRRFRFGLVLTLPVFALEMGGHLTGLVDHLGLQTSNWVQFPLSGRPLGGLAVLRAVLAVAGDAPT